MPSVVHVLCECGVTVHVFPSELNALFDSVVPEDARDHIPGLFAELRSDDGARFATADGSGHFVCPACGANNYVPQIDLN